MLGIEPGQPYEELRRPFEPGAAVVLYTDGVVEARREGELYGEERLDRCSPTTTSSRREELAEAVARASAAAGSAATCATTARSSSSGVCEPARAATGRS